MTADTRAIGRTLRVGTRKSTLALRQTDEVVRALTRAHPGLEVTTCPFETTGDRRQSAMSTTSGKGEFTKELEDALLAGVIDTAVHSLKDVPPAVATGLALGAVTQRRDPHDVFIGAHRHRLDELSAGSVIATASLRRRCQLMHHYPELVVTSIRGNVTSRLDMLDGKRSGPNIDGLILAGCGLERLGLADRTTETLPFEWMLPAAAQGALAVEVRADDDATRALLSVVDDADTRCAVAAERALLRALGAGCQVPMGVLATLDGQRVQIQARVLSLDGQTCVEGMTEVDANDVHAGGESLARYLLEQGADVLLQAFTNSPELS